MPYYPPNQSYPANAGSPPILYPEVSSSSVQIGQSGTGYVTQQSPRSTSSQPQKTVTKASNAQRQRKSEHPGSSIPGRDLRQAAAASAGYKRLVKDEVLARQISPYWSVFPPDAPPPKNAAAMVRAFTAEIQKINAREMSSDDSRRQEQARMAFHDESGGWGSAMDVDK